MTPLSADQLAAIRARAEAAGKSFVVTEAKRDLHEARNPKGMSVGMPKVQLGADRVEWLLKALEATARSDVPALLADLEAAQGRAARLKAALNHVWEMGMAETGLAKKMSDYAARAALEKGAAPNG